MRSVSDKHSGVTGLQKGAQMEKSEVTFKLDTDRALEELEILQKALLDGFSESFEEVTLTTTQTDDFLGLEDSLFSNNNDSPARNRHNGNSKLLGNH